MASYFVGARFFANAAVAPEMRTVVLQKGQTDYQSILDGFENAELTVEDNVADFVGYQTIDASLFKTIDKLSMADAEAVIGGNIKYHFTYDVETNVVTIEAAATLPDGTIVIDTISGVGFYNDAGEIDAVMNIDGEGILLSEMQNAGVIQNCGWFSKLIKAVAITVAVVAVVVAVAAVVVVTAGAAAPALVAAGVGAASAAVAVTTATSIAATSLTVAMIAAGVAITAHAIDVSFQGVNYRLEDFANMAKQLIIGFYYLAATTKDGGLLVSPVRLPTIAVAAAALSAGMSVYSPDLLEAREVAKIAGGGVEPKHEYRHRPGYFNHYHAWNITCNEYAHGGSHAFYGVPIL